MLFLPREEAQGLVEYALILVLVAIVVIGILLVFCKSVSNLRLPHLGLSLFF